MCFKMTTKTQKNMTQSKTDKVIVTKKQTQKTKKHCPVFQNNNNNFKMDNLRQNKLI
jgi:UDP-3-O-[3-hydroxymyristoyl] glucosamine N-acyltransferase